MQAKTRSAHQQMTLPGHFFTSREIFDRESELIFSKRWIYFDRSSRIKAPGSYLLYESLGESIIVLRNPDGQIGAFYNVCRHRGTRLCKAEGQFSKSIQCPYHAWTYALDGKLIGAPNMNEIPSFDKADYPLLPVPAAEWEGGIFLNLDQQALPLEQAFAPLMSRFSRWELSNLDIAHRIVYDVAANWKLILQNYSECYHCPNLHPLLNKLTPYRNSSNDLDEGPFLGGPMHMSIAGGSMTIGGQRCASPLGKLGGEDLNRVYYYVLFPNMLLSLHPDYVLIHNIQRIAADRTKIDCCWLFHPSAIARPGFDPSPAIEFWNMTNQQDWEVCELSQKGVSSRAYVPGPYAELESMIAALDREYLKAIT